MHRILRAVVHWWSEKLRDHALAGLHGRLRVLWFVVKNARSCRRVSHNIGQHVHVRLRGPSGIESGDHAGAEGVRIDGSTDDAETKMKLRC